MKSRKAQKRSSSSSNKSAVRRSVQRTFETLEERRLMTVQPWSDGKYYFPGGEMRSYLPTTEAYERYRQISKIQFADAQVQSGGGEGAGPTQQVTEAEPNNFIGQAQFVPLGNLPGQYQQVDVVGTMVRNSLGFDEDYFAFDLKAGDILDGRISAPVANFDVTFLNASGVEIGGNDTTIPKIIIPPSSPLSATTPAQPDGSVAGLSIVVPADGRYYARVSQGNTAYSLRLRTYRSLMEAEPIGTKQKIFLDFDGATIRRDIFAGAAFGTGNARLSALSTFLTSWGLEPKDENMVIDKIVNYFRSRFIGPGSPQVNGGNGYYSGTGVPGDYDIEILNSRDHADPWGLPNVSRIIIGGTSAESGLPQYAIAESIDVGNFDREETAVVLLEDIFLDIQASIPISPASSVVEAATKAIGLIAAHEAGHFFGNWHTLNNNASDQIMDTGGNLPGLIGVGRDGIFGTSDDLETHFGTDTYDTLASGVAYGIQNSSAVIATGLSTGMAGAYINGSLFLDVNVNRTREASEPAVASWRVYADLNNDGAYQFGEPQAITRLDGTYSLGVGPGSYVIRVDHAPVPGYRVTTPVAGFFSLTVANGQIVSNNNFGLERIDQSATGFKFNDLNGNGLVDAGEPRIAGVWIYIDLDGDQRIDLGEPQTRTDANGRYSLKFPGPGTYTVRELIEPGYVQTLPGPAQNNAYTVTVTGTAADGPNLSGLNFGNRLFLDFGDAPNSYGTLVASNGARHGFVSGLFLGANWDSEQDGKPTTTALGDDLAGDLDASDQVIDDEDGVVLARPISRTTTNLLSVTASTTADTAYLQAWLDLNGDGDFTDSGEKIISNQIVTTGTQTVSFPALGGATLGDTFMRVRLSTDRDLGPVGLSASGEVEDYRVTIVNAPEIAVADSFEVSRNSTLNSLDVTANDFKVTGEVLTIITAGPSRAGGIVVRTNDNKILYTPPNGFVGTDTFPYTVQTSTGETSTTNVSVTVNLFFEDPRAIDDSYDVPTNAVSFPLNVLANDIEGRAGALSIISVTSPTLGGQISIATGGQSLRYTPARGLGDTETFTYTVADASGKTSTANVTLHTLPGDQTNDDVLIKLVATDLSGNTITAIPQGQDFRIDMYVDDLRNDRSSPPFVAAPGVFAAYADLLYNLQLVSTVPSTNPGARFDFEVTFDSGYTQVQLGDASIPGIIDDFGALNPALSMNQPDPVRLASIRFTARSPGLATFTPDPAEDPVAETLLFDSQDTEVPLEKIRFVGTTLEIVGDSTEFPQAVDDSFSSNVPANAQNFPLLVLPNDRTGSTGSVRLFSATQPANGSVTISNNGTPNDLTDDRILYTPNTGFTGTDTFTYTIQDSRAIQSTAKVTVRVGSAAVTDANDQVALRLELYKADGTPLADGERLNVGAKFQLRGFVQDLRSPFDGGVFAAFEDVIYNANLASVDADATNALGFAITFGPDYSRTPPVRSGDARTPGLINEVGAVQAGDAPLGPSEKLLFIITLTANAVGNLSFIGDPADISPLHDTLLFQPPTAVAIDRIRYGFDSVQIVASGGSGEGFTNGANPYDVNADGVVSPMDVLNVINALNSGGPRSFGGSGGEGEDPKMFLDVNADGSLSAMDALLVINYLNKNLSGEGESANDSALAAEGEDDSVDSLLDVLAPEIDNVWKRK